MVTASVSINRTSLALPALLIAGDGSPPYSLTEAGLGRPAITARTQYAGQSPWIHGQTHVAVVKEQTALPLEVLIQGNTSGELDQLIGDLDAALWQFDFTVTVTVNGAPTAWNCSPASWSVKDGVVMHHNVAAFFEVLAISIPCHPIPGA